MARGVLHTGLCHFDCRNVRPGCSAAEIASLWLVIVWIALCRKVAARVDPDGNLPNPMCFGRPPVATWRAELTMKFMNRKRRIAVGGTAIKILCGNGCGGHLDSFFGCVAIAPPQWLSSALRPRQPSRRSIHHQRQNTQLVISSLALEVVDFYPFAGLARANGSQTRSGPRGSSRSETRSGRRQSVQPSGYGKIGGSVCRLPVRGEFHQHAPDSGCQGFGWAHFMKRPPETRFCRQGRRVGVRDVFPPGNPTFRTLAF